MPLERVEVAPGGRAPKSHNESEGWVMKEIIRKVKEGVGAAIRSLHRVLASTLVTVVVLAPLASVFKSGVDFTVSPSEGVRLQIPGQAKETETKVRRTQAPVEISARPNHSPW